MTRAKALLAMLLTGSGTLLAAGAGGRWQTQVPAADRARQNPEVNTPDAAAGGEKLFAQHCASCHGSDAAGRGRRPSLRTARVREATDGELQWLLRNGELAHGMPAWSNLPEVQRWQLVLYLHSLPITPDR